LVEFEIIDVKFEEGADGTKILKMPDLTKEEKKDIDPIVAPTSGLRIQIFDIETIEGHETYTLTNRNLFLFLRVFKAISQKFKQMKSNQNLKVLIVTDNRPSKDILLNYCSQIFAYDGFDVYHQQDDHGASRLSSPYGAASVALYKDINLILVLTASHNEISWNGIKFYIDYPIPISGSLFKEITKIALEINEISLKSNYTPILIDAEQKNNDYVIELLSKIMKIESLRNKNIVIWPYLGKARGIVNLFKQLGANVFVIEEELNPPNPLKNIKEDVLQLHMTEAGSNIAILLDADRDRIVLYVKQDGEYFTYIPNEIYSAMHNILSRKFNKKIINVRTIPSDLRGDETSVFNVFTGVGYKHLGVILYFLMDIPVEPSKVNTAILYLEQEDKSLIKLSNPFPLKNKIINLMKKHVLNEEQFVVVMWEESGGHTVNILNVSKSMDSDNYIFSSPLPLIADKYPVLALVLITELICRGNNISESIDWTIKGINQTIHAVDEEKIKIMNNFKENDNKTIMIDGKEYKVSALSDNNDMVDIYRLKSENSTLYFRPSGTGPDVRFYIFGKRETHLNEIKKMQEYIKNNYL